MNRRFTLKYLTPMMLALMLVLLALPLTACFQSSTVVHVKADGSGTIEQRTLLSEAASKQPLAVSR